MKYFCTQGKRSRLIIMTAKQFLHTVMMSLQDSACVKICETTEIISNTNLKEMKCFNKKCSFLQNIC